MMKCTMKWKLHNINQNKIKRGLKVKEENVGLYMKIHMITRSEQDSKLKYGEKC
jgi:hypothetical protein